MANLDKRFILRVAMVSVVILIMVVLFSKLTIDKLDRKNIRIELKQKVVNECTLIHTNMVDRNTIVTYECPDTGTYEFIKNK